MGAIEEPFVIGQDNNATINLIRAGKPLSERTKHISLRKFWLTERIQEKEIAVEYVPTKDMIADILTKPLQGELFRHVRSLLMGHKYKT